LEGFGAQDWLRHWQDGQQAFWSSAVETGVSGAGAFASPDWQAFDDAMAHVLAVGATGEDEALREAARDAGARYRDIVQAAFGRTRDAFAVQCRALQGGSAHDWRVFRELWFDLAEDEFIRTMRTPEFLAAQRDGIRSAGALWARLPEDVRALARDRRRLAATAGHTLVRLGAEMVQIAQTPCDLVWEEGRTTLWRYRALGAPPDLGPVLICHGLIGRQTMTDLRPGRSLVRNLLAAGVDVLTVDWGSAGLADTGLGLDHFVGRKIPSLVEAGCRATGAEALTVFGICQGGTLAACHAALTPNRLSGLITAVAPFDFHADRHDADPSHGLLHVWMRALEDADIEMLIAMDGNLSGELMGLVFNQLNPVRTLAKYTIEMLDLAADPAGLATFLAMENWLADRPDMPGALARTWLIDLYRRNALISGDLSVSGRAVDLARIEAPVLNVFATGDHIIPPPCSRALGAILEGRDYSELALQTGHVGAFVSARSQTRMGPAIVDWLRRRRISG